MTSISSISITSPLRQSVTQTQAELTATQTEISTGTLADIGLTLGAQTGTSLSLKSQIDQLTTYTNSNNFVSTRLSSTSTTLDSMISTAQTMEQDLVTATTSGGLTPSMQTNAKNSLQALSASLNTSAGGQYIYGGINTDKTPIADYFSTTPSSAKTAVDTAFQSTFGTSQTSASASSITGAQMTSFLGSQFDTLFNSSNWQSTWSSASSQTIQSTVAPGQTATTSVSANATPFQQLAEAYTMLNEFTGQNLSSDAKAAVVSKASSLVSTALASLTDMQSNVGVTQNTVTSANSGMSAQISVLTTNVNDLESVDTYSLSTKVTQLQTQLEASYELTSQLKQLSLVNYLTG